MCSEEDSYLGENYGLFKYNLPRVFFLIRELSVMETLDNIKCPIYKNGTTVAYKL